MIPLKQVKHAEWIVQVANKAKAFRSTSQTPRPSVDKTLNMRLASFFQNLLSMIHVSIGETTDMHGTERPDRFDEYSIRNSMGWLQTCEENEQEIRAQLTKQRSPTSPPRHFTTTQSSMTSKGQMQIRTRLRYIIYLSTVFVVEVSCLITGAMHRRRGNGTTAAKDTRYHMKSLWPVEKIRESIFDLSLKADISKWEICSSSVADGPLNSRASPRNNGLN